ncbi:MAG: M20 family metallopeptidase [Clostridiales bacterium]|jgi:amidohydrolase|nr:M20 family metallopeptidase [Clostridiales bacterium]
MNWLEEAKKIEPEIIAWRRDFHRHPEIGNREYRTTEKIKDVLESCGIETRQVLKTGIIGILRNGDGPSVAFRADIDALPVTEEVPVPFASEVDGMMHACGHDIHTASLLGAAKLLSLHREAFSGTAVFIFQPDEEGDGGAQRILDTGILDELKVRSVYGAHGNPFLPPGTVGVKYGRFYAAACVYDVTVHGKGTHGAEPENGTDSLYAAARMCAALKEMTGVYHGERAVVTVGEFHAGTARNIISDHANFSGILRTAGLDLREEMEQKIRKTLDQIADEAHVTYDLRMQNGYVGVTNHDEQTRLVQDAASALLGADHVQVEQDATMTTEDFGFYLLKYPGAYYHIGIGSPYPLHSPKMCPDESALVTAAAVHAAVMTEELM